MLLPDLLIAPLFLTPSVHAGAWLQSVLPPPYDRFALIAASLLLTLFLIWGADGLLRRLYWGEHFRRKRGHDAPALIRDISTVFLLAFGVSVWLYLALGVSAAGLLAASGATAVVIGLALQTMILDFFSGLSVSLDRSYEIGEWLTVHGEELGGAVYGRVEGITWRSTVLRLADGCCILIPNRIVTSNPVTNHSRPLVPKRYEVEIGLDGRVPYERAMRLLSGEAFKGARQPGLTVDPAPRVFMGRITNDGIYYIVHFYGYPDRLQPHEAHSLMLTALQGALERLGLPVPVQQIELMPPPAVTTTLDVRNMLTHVALFGEVLNETQIGELAASCRAIELPAHSHLMEQGAAASSMFVILEGAAEIRVVNAPGGSDQSVAVLASGDIVGEMSLMTGAPRSATVIALTKLSVLEIPKDVLEPLFAHSPELVEKFGRVLAQRGAELKGLAGQAVALKQTERDIIARMKSFFSRAFGASEKRAAQPSPVEK